MEREHEARHSTRHKRRTNEVQPFRLLHEIPRGALRRVSAERDGRLQEQEDREERDATDWEVDEEAPALRETRLASAARIIGRR